MTFDYTYEKLNNLIISKTKIAFKVKWKNFFLVSQVFSFRHTKQDSKNVVDTTFKKPFDRTVHETKLLSSIAYNILSVWKLLSAATCRDFAAGFYRSIVFAFFFLRLNYLILGMMVGIWLVLGWEGAKWGYYLKMRVESSPQNATSNVKPSQSKQNHGK